MARRRREKKRLRMIAFLKAREERQRQERQVQEAERHRIHQETLKS